MVKLTRKTSLKGGKKDAAEPGATTGQPIKETRATRIREAAKRRSASLAEIEGLLQEEGDDILDDDADVMRKSNTAQYDM